MKGDATLLDCSWVECKWSELANQEGKVLSVNMLQAKSNLSKLVESIENGSEEACSAAYR